MLVRSDAEFSRGRNVVDFVSTDISVLTMHDAKGREFEAVLLLACDEGVIPSSDRLLFAYDERGLAEVYETERHLLYVAATRARKFLWISGVAPVSEFVEDLLGVP